MSRKIFISSDISVDDRLIEVSECAPTAALMWPWLLTAFDDWGRAEASTKRLKAQVFPAQATITTETIEEALTLYAQVGLIDLYTVGDRRYMAIPSEKWFSYQTHIRSEKREREGSRIPAPERADVPMESEQRAITRNHAQSRADARLTRADATTLHYATPSPSPQETTPSLPPQTRARVRGELDRQPKAPATPPTPPPSSGGSSTSPSPEIERLSQSVAEAAHLNGHDPNALAQQLGPHRARDPARLVAEAAKAREWATEHHKAMSVRLLGNWLDRTFRQEDAAATAAAVTANNHTSGGFANGVHPTSAAHEARGRTNRRRGPPSSPAEADAYYADLERQVNGPPDADW